MIPLRIHLKNFLSYGTKLQTIHFDHHRLICLNGKNGHGKSALLDAITWALWGQARKITGMAKPDAHLLHLGQSSMLVMLDFMLNNQTYRVKREFYTTAQGNGQSSLEIGILADDQTTRMPLTEKTIRDTQKKIEALLGMSYECFINSAFLRQGSANEFSKKTPKERKDILAQILQLDVYEMLRKAAQEKGKKLQNEHDIVQFSLQALQEKIATEQQVIQEQNVLEKELHAVENSIKNLVRQHTTLLYQKEELAKAAQEKKMIQEELEQLLKQKKSQEEELQQLATDWHATHKTLLQIYDPCTQKKQQELTATIARLQQQQQHVFIHKEQQLKLKEEYQRIFSSLQEDHIASVKKKEVLLERFLEEKKYNEQRYLEISHEKENLELELCTATEKIVQISAIINAYSHEEYTILEKKFEKGRTYYAQWSARAKMLHQELESIEQKKTLSQDIDNACCPLCEQNLSLARTRFLLAKLQKLDHATHHRLQRLTTNLQSLKPLLIDQHKQLELLKQKYQEITEHRTKLLSIQEHKNTVEKAIQEKNVLLQALQKKSVDIAASLEAEKKSLLTLTQDFEQKIATHSTLAQLKRDLQKAEHALASSSFNQHDYEVAMQSLKNLQNLYGNEQVHEKEKNIQYERRQRISLLIQQLKALKKQTSELIKKISKFESIQSQLETCKKEEAKITYTQQQEQQKKELILQNIGSLNHELSYIDKAKKEHVSKENEMTTLQHAIHDYTLLTTALSKNGIQALLIEDALPEIEHEANYILARLTNNQSHIIIDSLRDLKKGGNKETLDIKISDSLGIRPYELFSGGEAFRIDFALRIAISKLLARRAGTSLQTLIIDEGFGSQDEEGLTLLMDALHNIQEDFSKIIVVSHLTDMKEQFPVHFYIEKNAHGSTVRIVEY